MKNVMRNIVLASLVAFFGCGELSEVTIEGLPGPQGPMGPQGPAGTSCGIVGNSIVCTDGSSLDLDVFGCSAERVEAESNEYALVVEESQSGVLVTCQNGDEVTQVFISDGADGRDGIDGQDGADGQDGENGQDGSDGSDGNDGQDGSDGEDGSSCSVFEVEDADSCFSISCTDGTEVTFCFEDEDDDKEHCNNGNGNGSEGCSPSDNGNDDE